MENESLEIFAELGMTQNESRVYQTLIEFGFMGAGQISAKSRVSYSKIYNVLDSLVAKGLVKIIPEKTKKFSAADPESFVKLIEHKEEKLSEARNKIKQLKKFYDVKDKNPVILGVGKKGFHKIVDEIKKTDKYCYNIKWTSEYREELARKREESMNNGKDFRDLVRYDKETEKNVRKWLEISKNIKQIDNQGVAFSVVDDREVMISLIKSNVTLLIRDKPFAKIMKKMFVETYKTADSIK